MSLTIQQAKKFFEDMNGLNCDPSNPTASCIPFMLPATGCWARAHEMCRQILVQGITPQKIWIKPLSDSLKLFSANSKNCEVLWSWHVAPIVGVDLGDGPQNYVIDPSIFDEPVTVAVWTRVQGGGVSYVTPWTQYSLNVQTKYSDYNQPDPDLDIDLSFLRSQLQNQIPPPPYAVCQADVYIRDNHTSSSVRSLDNYSLNNAGISMSPDINHYQQPLVNPQAGLEDEYTKTPLFEPIKPGQANYFYFRLQNRGTAAARADIDLYYTLPSTLPTPESWTLIGSLSTPAIFPQNQGFSVVGPIAWNAIPQAQHYCFVALLGTSNHPKPNIQNIRDITDSYYLIRGLRSVNIEGNQAISGQIANQGWPLPPGPPDKKGMVWIDGPAGSYPGPYWGPSPGPYPPPWPPGKGWVWVEQAIAGKNVAWKNDDVVDANIKDSRVEQFGGGRLVTLPFLVQGWPNREYQGELEIRLRLPSGVFFGNLQIEKHLVEGTVPVGMKKGKEEGDIAYYALKTTTDYYITQGLPTALPDQSVLQNITLKPGLRSQAKLCLYITPRHPFWLGASQPPPPPLLWIKPTPIYEVSVCQKINGMDLGRVTWRPKNFMRPHWVSVADYEKYW